jgi:GST-like protein
MIDLYTWTTPNGRKISILLEELGVPYEAHGVDITAGQQHDPAFRKVAPAGRIPAIRDRETGQVMMESGAIMLYLAERFGRFVPRGDDRWRCIEWLMWQMGSMGPFLGQAHHFLHYNPGVSDYGAKRYHAEAERIYATLNTQLRGREFVVGAGAGEYSIADMAIWPWVSRFQWHEIDLNGYPEVRRWYVALAGREAVQKGYHQPFFVNEVPIPADPG